MERKPILAILALAGLLSTGAPAGDEATSGEKPAAEAPNPDAAPPFALKDLDGKERKFEEFKGKLVVLEWVNHGCPFVKKHYGTRNMQELQKAYTEKGVVWLSICSSAPGKQGHMTAEEWTRKNEELGAKPTAVLLDPTGAVGKAYGAKTTPQFCIVDGNGIRVYDGAIDDRPSANPVDVREAKSYVKEALDALLAGNPPPTRRTKPYG